MTTITAEILERFDLGYSLKEIADDIGISERSVRTIIHSVWQTEMELINK